MRKPRDFTPRPEGGATARHHAVSDETRIRRNACAGGGRAVSGWKGLGHRLLRQSHAGAAQPGPAAIAEADALVNAGHALEDRGDLPSALAQYQHAARIAPGHARARLNLGNALAGMGRTDEARAAYREAMRLQPDHATARFNLARLLAADGNSDDAERMLREALAIDPALAEACVSLAELLSNAGREAEAECHLRQALALRPDYAGAAFNLGRMLVRQDRFEEAIDLLALGNRFATDTDSWMLFELNNRPDIDRSRAFDLHVRVGANIRRQQAARFDSWTNVADPDRRLRIGYVSGDLRAHPIGMLMKPVLQHHHGDSVEVHCYSNNTSADAITEVLRKLVPNWHDVAGLGHDDLGELVRRHGIDILVDLSGHTNHNRLATFARHPAPVQVTWMGYLNTSGLPAMDYRISDAYADPPGESDAYYTETVMRLPHSQWCYEPWLGPAGTVRRDGTPGRTRVGSINNHLKISDACADLWARILREEPRLDFTVLDVPSGERTRFLDRFVSRGVDPTRITLHDRLPINEYYGIVGDLDLALDTYPYSGGTTTLDALWMGTPLIARNGERPISRSAYSILRTMEMPELIAQAPDEYVDANLRLARDEDWRRLLRSSLRRRLEASPLMNADGFVADLERCYRDMWRTWCASHAA